MLQEDHAALKTEHTKSQQLIMRLERQCEQFRADSVHAQLQKANERIKALEHDVEYWKRRSENYEADHDKSREIMRGFDAGGGG